MFDWIYIASYISVYHQLLLVIGLFILLHAYVYDIHNQSSLLFFRILGSLLLCWLILYIGQRPISGSYFGDTSTYAQSYALFSKKANITIKNDYLFNYLQVLFFNNGCILAFTLVAFIYVV